MTRKSGHYPCGENFDQNSVVVAQYIYKLADGSPYLMVKRTSDKQFPQFRYRQRTDTVDPNNEINWQRGEARPKIPYMLHYLATHAKPEDTLYICEGEKDAETLIDLGLFATCTSGGVHGWDDNVSEEIVNRFTTKIFVMEDNDKPGYDHAKRVVKSLLRCGFKGELYIVNFRDQRLNFDTSDWVGKTTEMTQSQLMERMAAFLSYCEERKQLYEPPVLAQIVLDEGEFATIADMIESEMVKTHGVTHNAMLWNKDIVRPIWRRRKNALGFEYFTTELEKFDGWYAFADFLTKRVCEFYRWKEFSESEGKGKKGVKVRKLVKVPPPKDIITALVKRTYSRLPKCTGLIHCPSMRDDGSLITEEGYDRYTGMFMCHDEYFADKELSKEFTKDAAKEALGVLRGLLDEFRFVTPTDEAVALSAILASVARCAFVMCPMYLYVAPMPGTGKSFLADLVSTIAVGHECPVMIMSTGQNADQENEKRLGAQFISGSQIFSLDNLPPVIGGDFLCVFTERPNLEVRILGKTEKFTGEWRGVVQGTGNNTRVKADAIRRVMTAHLDAMEANPENRRFKKNPLVLINQDRMKYISAALTIVKAYVDSGEQVDCDPAGSFNEWSRIAREPLIWLGMPDIIDNVKAAKKEDPADEVPVELIEMWQKYVGVGKAINVKELIRLANVNDELRDFMLVHWRDPSDRNAIDRRLFGISMRKFKGKIYMIEDNEQSKVMKFVSPTQSSAHGNTWMLTHKDWSPGDGFQRYKLRNDNGDDGDVAM